MREWRQAYRVVVHGLASIAVLVTSALALASGGICFASVNSAGDVLCMWGSCPTGDCAVRVVTYTKPSDPMDPYNGDDVEFCGCSGQSWPCCTPARVYHDSSWVYIGFGSCEEPCPDPQGQCTYYTLEGHGFADCQ